MSRTAFFVVGVAVGYFVAVYSLVRSMRENPDEWFARIHQLRGEAPGETA